MQPHLPPGAAITWMEQLNDRVSRQSQVARGTKTDWGEGKTRSVCRSRKARTMLRVTPLLFPHFLLSSQRRGQRPSLVGLSPPLGPPKRRKRLHHWPESTPTGSGRLKGREREPQRQDLLSPAVSWNTSQTPRPFYLPWRITQLRPDLQGVVFSSSKTELEALLTSGHVLLPG